jgi:membrane protein insertase Oxa1/YidC/SpoIIIJ
MSVEVVAFNSLTACLWKNLLCLPFCLSVSLSLYVCLRHQTRSRTEIRLLSFPFSVPNSAWMRILATGSRVAAFICVFVNRTYWMVTCSSHQWTILPPIVALLLNRYNFTLLTLKINNWTGSIVYVTVIVRFTNTTFLSTKLDATFPRLSYR